MTSFLLAILFVTGPPLDEIKLDNRGIYLTNVHYGSVRLEEDGTYTTCSKYHMWHWDSNGQIINRIGGKGEGPGEFEAMGSVFWDGTYYWVIDARRKMSSVFDRTGRFLLRNRVYYRQLLQVDGRLFGIDTSHFDPFRINYPPTIQELRYEINEQALTVNHLGAPFKKVTALQLAYRFNFKLVWMVADKDRYLVVDQLEPKIRIYDRAALLQEQALENKTPFEPPAIRIQAPLWIPPPSEFASNIKSDSAFKRWWWSWSRINYFGKAGNDFVLVYQIPDPDFPESSLQAIQRIGRDGKAIGEALILKGLCMGIEGGDRIHLFCEDENSDKFDYYVRIYHF